MEELETVIAFLPMFESIPRASRLLGVLAAH